MDSRWSFFAFDWQRFLEVRPILLRACASGDFEEAVAAGAEADIEAGVPPEQVCNSLLAHLCGVGDSVVFDSGLPELLMRVRRRRRGADVAEPLAEAMSAGLNVEEWFRADQGIAGMLSPDQVRTLSAAADEYSRHYRPPARPRGLTGLRMRFSTTEPLHGDLMALVGLVRQAAEGGLGLAAYQEE